MRYRVHSSAVKEFKQLPDKISELVKNSIESRRNRDNPITDQRGTGIAYDNHGEPIHYFKIEDGEHNYRAFFDIIDNEVIILGIRPRNDDTYLNLREFTNRT